MKVYAGKRTRQLLCAEHTWLFWIDLQVLSVLDPNWKTTQSFIKVNLEYRAAFLWIFYWRLVFYSQNEQQFGNMNSTDSIQTVICVVSSAVT